MSPKPGVRASPLIRPPAGLSGGGRLPARAHRRHGAGASPRQAPLLRSGADALALVVHPVGPHRPAAQDRSGSRTPSRAHPLVSYPPHAPQCPVRTEGQPRGQCRPSKMSRRRAMSQLAASPSPPGRLPPFRREAGRSQARTVETKRQRPAWLRIGQVALRPATEERQGSEEQEAAHHKSKVSLSPCAIVRVSELSERLIESLQIQSTSTRRNTIIVA